MKTVDAIRKWMLYRPMLPDNRDVLFSGSVTTAGNPDEDIKLTAEVEHLTCFIGGMFGMSAKIFGIEGDLEIAKKLTDGCVWAYEATTSGIMPEGSIVLPCQSSEHCVWNETMYREYLDPMGAQRDQHVKDYDLHKKEADAALEAAKAQEPIAKEKPEQVVLDETSELVYNSSSPSIGSDALKKPEPVSLQKRQTSPKDDIPKPITHNFAEGTLAAKGAAPQSQQPPSPRPKKTLTWKEAEVAAQKTYTEKSKEAELELDSLVKTYGHGTETPPSDVKAPLPASQPPLAVAGTISISDPPTDPMRPVTLKDPMRPLTHEEYVTARIEQEALPRGFVSLRSRKYILRYFKIHRPNTAI